MSKQPRGLGRGLGALIPQMEEEDLTNRTEVPIDRISPNPFQPRKTFEIESLRELADSIANHGVLQPLLVREKDGFYQLIAGERRLRASKLAGLKVVPVIIKDFDDRTIMEIALVENLQREDLNPIEEAEAYRRLIQEFELTQEEIARTIGKSRSAVANTLRLLNLPEKIRAILAEDKISMGHARSMLALDSPEAQETVCREVIDQNLSVRETERLVKKILSGDVSRETSHQPKKVYTFANDPNLRAIIDELVAIYGTKIEIKGRENSGRIEIEYYSREELDRLIEMLVKKDY